MVSLFLILAQMTLPVRFEPGKAQAPPAERQVLAQSITLVLKPSRAARDLSSTTMLEQRIQQQFFESADLKYQSAELLSRPIQDAVAALVGSLTAGGRVLVAGLGTSASLAQLMASLLIGRFERDRPGLAAMVLGVDGATLAALATDPATAGSGGSSFDQVLSRQIQTLGQPGDVLLLIDNEGQHPALLAAAGAAQAKDMTVIAITGRTGGALRSALGETDVLVAVPHERRARVLETQLLVLHCLCDAIDQQLLGEQDPA